MCSRECDILSPQSIALTSQSVFFASNHSLRHCCHTSSSATSDSSKPLLESVAVIFLDVSPCEKYLLVGSKLKGNSYRHIDVFDLEEDKVRVIKETNHGLWNCGAWVPPSGPHGLRVCMGGAAGIMIILGTV